MSNENRSCAQCKFASREFMQGQIQRVLVCREGPPSVSLVPIPQPTGTQVQGFTQFPIVQPANWCYRFQQAEEGEKEETGSLLAMPPPSQ